MHSAFLLTESGWKFTNKPSVALDHCGDLLLNDDEFEQRANLELVGAREGKRAELWGETVVLTDSKLHNDPEAAFAELVAEGEVLCRSTSRFESVELPKLSRKLASYAPVPWEDEKQQQESVARWRGFVVEAEGRFFRLFRDEALWEAVETQKKRVARKRLLSSLGRLPNRFDFFEAAEACSNSLGTNYPKSFRLEQLLVWLAAHDNLRGRRATNKLVRTVALKWCNDRKKSKKWLARWSDESVAEETDKRLAAVLRLGDKNSRCKSR